MFLSVFIVQFVSAQDITLKGQVWDEVLNEPLIGVNVLVKGISQGVITDFDGNFTITAKKNQVLVFSFIGYNDVEVVVKPGMKLSRILMTENTQQIEEVVVVGYGQQKKASSVGAIVSTKGDDLLKVGSVTSVSEALQGQMPGVTAISTNSKPGADQASLFIRGKATWGSAAPLCLVDGMERNFNDVDVNEIESISVLKDASATAVYGVKGANGVILVTTKRGSNKKPAVSFSANFGFKQPTVDLEWAPYTTAMKLYNEASATDGKWENIVPESTIAAWEHAYATGNYGPYNDYFPQVDWWNETMKNFGFQQNYNLNIRGGTERMAYFASVGYLNDGDIYDIKKQAEFDPRFYYKRYNWRTNFDFNITKSTKLSVNIAGKMGYRNQPGARDPQNDNYLGLALSGSPNEFPIKYSDGEWGATRDGGGSSIANYENRGQRQYKSFQGFYDVILNQNLDMITKGLSVKATISYNTSSNRESEFTRAGIGNDNVETANNNAYIRYHREYDYANPIVNEDGSIDYPLLINQRFPDDQTVEELPVSATHDKFQSYSRNLYYEIALNYKRSFGDHNVTGLALFNRKISDSANTSGMEFPSYEEDWVGRVTYNWKERYLTEINAAYTGSEKFAPGKRFGFFPSFSLGWRITEEPFMKKIREKWLTNLKVRYSYGKVGNDAGAPRFNYIQIFSSSGSYMFGKYQDVAYGPLYSEGKLAYPNSTWETSTKQNLGIEMTLINKLNINLDLFKERRTGLLMQKNTIGPWMGIAVGSVNLGETKNHGLEFEVAWHDKIGKDCNYFAKFNFSTSENRVVFKDDPSDLDDYLKQAGKPIGFANKYIVSGNLSSIDDIFNSTETKLGDTGTKNYLAPGDFAYIDYNADGIIDGKDTVPLENLSYPLTTYGLSLGFTYKGFGVNALFYATSGLYKEDIGNFLWDFPGDKIQAQPDLDRWTMADRYSTEIIHPAPRLQNDYNEKSSTFTYTNYSYLRLKNFEISYSLPKSLIKKLNISSCQLYVNGNNLFTISNVDKRRDPETGSSSVYPIVRRYNAGVRLSF